MLTVFDTVRPSITPLTRRCSEHLAAARAPEYRRGAAPVVRFRSGRRRLRFRADDGVVLHDIACRSRQARSPPHSGGHRRCQQLTGHCLQYAASSLVNHPKSTDRRCLHWQRRTTGVVQWAPPRCRCTNSLLRRRAPSRQDGRRLLQACRLNCLFGQRGRAHLLTPAARLGCLASCRRWGVAGVQEPEPVATGATMSQPQLIRVHGSPLRIARVPRSRHQIRSGCPTHVRILPTPTACRAVVYHYQLFDLRPLQLITCGSGHAKVRRISTPRSTRQTPSLKWSKRLAFAWRRGPCRRGRRSPGRIRRLHSGSRRPTVACR